MIASEKPGQTGIRFSANYFLFFAIYGVSGPYLQIILRRIGYSPASVGLLLALYELIGIAGPIFLARKADAAGRFNPFLLASGGAILGGLALLVTIKSPLATVAGLGLLSLGLKTPVPVLDASALKAIDAERLQGRKAPNYGVIRAIGSIGFVIVTLSVQSIAGFDASPPAVMAFAIGILTLGFLAGLAWLPEMGSGRRSAKKSAPTFTWINSTFLIGLAVISLGRLAMAPIGSFFSLYLVESLGWHAIGAMSALGAAVEIPMLMFAWRLMRRRSPIQLIGIASVAIVARLLIYAIFPTRVGVVFGQLLHSLCYGLFQPAAVTFISLRTPTEERTTGMALLLGFGMGLPAVLGSALGGVVVEAVGYRWLFAIFSLFAIASLLLYRANAQSLKSVR